MKAFISTILLSLFVSLAASAQQKGGGVYQGLLSIKLHPVVMEGDSVYWSMDISVQGLTIGRTQSLSFTPIIYSLDGRQALTLPPVILNGKDKHRLIEREKALENKYKVDDTFVYTTIGYFDNIRITTIPYDISFEFEDWMVQSGFRIVGDLLDYEGYPTTTFVDTLSEDLQIGVYNEEYYYPEEDYVQ
ncbi:DUF3868 domain-containing protein [Parabacteroides sp. OttesenSCG-928-N08]|nr:DUF3868 domain-containing protein [Parabacteroides sp. OttesenSCG-928-N08]